MRIGIGITTHNRPEIFTKTLEHLKRFTPETKIVVVDDGSEIPCLDASFRFDTNVGIAKAKNKCLELLSDCEHIFLFDDDCYPTVDRWYEPYIDSSEPHLMYIFKDFATGRKLNDTKILFEDSQLVSYSHPRGCMLYFDRKILDVVGGYDTRYGRWGFEHGDISNRIYNNRLTSHRYADVKNSSRIFFSLDEHEQVQGTVKGDIRHELLTKNRVLHNENFRSKAYCEYRQPNNIILTSYLVSHIDPQRNKTWKPNIADLKPLIDSCIKHNQKLVILNDCFENSNGLIEFVKVDSKINPYFQRWLSEYQYLRDRPKIDQVFCVDATDVRMLNDPFENLDPHVLYVGDEPSNVGCAWMRKNFRGLSSFLNKYEGETLLNCGVVGGSRNMVMGLCHDMAREYFDDPKRTGDLEMGIFNWLCYNEYPFVSGRHITSIFKKFEKDSSAWFAHK